MNLTDGIEALRAANRAGYSATLASGIHPKVSTDPACRVTIHRAGRLDLEAMVAAFAETPFVPMFAGGLGPDSIELETRQRLAELAAHQAI